MTWCGEFAKRGRSRLIPATLPGWCAAKVPTLVPTSGESMGRQVRRSSNSSATVQGILVQRSHDQQLEVDRMRAARHVAFAIAVITLVATSVGCQKQVVTVNQSTKTWVSGMPAQVRAVTRLPSGYVLRVIQEGPLWSTTAHKVIALMLAYQTDLPVNDISDLKREANGIFKYVRGDAERGGYTAMILSATRISPAGEESGYRFVYERSRSGMWIHVE
jgi:hypothetical protein